MVRLPFQSFLGFRQTADIDIILDGAETRKMAEMKTEDGKKEKHYLFFDGETVSGKVRLPSFRVLINEQLLLQINVTLRKHGVKLEHHGIKVEFIGEIELYQDRGNHHEFTSLVKDLARPGELTSNTSYSFEFVNVEKPYESYTGSNVRLRYFLRVTISRRLADVVKEVELIVHTLSSYPEVNSPIKMEVGIEDCLHIEFEYNKSKYHLKDVIVGKIYFLLVRIKIKHMEIAIIKRETTGIGQNTFNENETIAKYEIMDGAPVRGESIPIRLFLAGYDLTPTMKDINKKFSVRYYLNLVLVDEEERRYFKQQEIILWRKGDRTRRQIQQPVGTTAYISTRDKEAAAASIRDSGVKQSSSISTVAAVAASSPTGPTIVTSSEHNEQHKEPNTQTEEE
jgi:vacuolar protein sorting-associated protein 26